MKPRNAASQATPVPVEPPPMTRISVLICFMRKISLFLTWRCGVSAGVACVSSVAHAVSAIAAQCHFGQLAAVSTAPFTDYLLDQGHSGQRHAEFGDAQTKEQWNGPNVAGHLSAERNGQFPLHGCHANVADHVEDGRVKRIGQLRNVAVGPVAGHHILGQIVGADAEEIDHFGQVAGNERGGRHFDEHAQLNVAAPALRAAEQFAYGRHRRCPGRHQLLPAC